MSAVAVTVTHESTCPFCGAKQTIKVDATDYLLWRSGRCVQDVFHYLSVDDREILVSSICKSCWDDTFDDE